MLLSLVTPVLTLLSTVTIVQPQHANVKLVERINDAIVQHGGVVVGSVLVARNGEVVYARSNGESRNGIQAGVHTLFDIASVSKQFTAAAILKLQMQGKLSVQDSLAKHLSEVPESHHKITIHHLLTHTSGLDQHLDWNVQKDLHSRDLLLASFGRLNALHSPGTQYQYSNVGYFVLAAIIELASGSTYEDYLKAELFEPAGMRDTGFVYDPTLDKDFATHGVIGRHSRGWHWGYKGSGGIVSSAAEMYAWHQALQGDAVLDANSRELLFAKYLNGYALGWFIEEHPVFGRIAKHSGAVPGYNAYFERGLDEDYTIIVVGNEIERLLELGKHLRRAALLAGQPKLVMRLDAKACEFDEYKAIHASEGIGFDAIARSSKLVELTVHDSQSSFLQFEMDPETATQLAADIAAIVKQYRERGQKMESGVDVSVYTTRLQLDQDRRTALSSGLEWMVLPRYRGQTPSGPIVDNRATIVLVNTKSRMWNVIMKLDDVTANKFHEVLNNALELMHETHSSVDPSD